MKKLTFAIPILFLFLHFMYAGDGPNIWTTSLTAAGQIWSVAVNPANQDIIYAASNTQGMWKTTNGGLTWTAINAGITNMTLNAVALSPANPNIVYCGGGAAAAANGMYRSTDAGATWTQVNTGITQSPNTVQAIAVSQTDANTVYIGVWDGGATSATVGLYKTNTGGVGGWAAANVGMGTNKNILSIAIDPSNANVIYAGTSFIPPATGPTYVYKSTDAATSWVNSSTGFGTTATDQNPVRALSISTANPSIVLAGLFLNPGSTNGGAWLSTNAGVSWTRIHNAALPSLDGTLIRSCLIRPGSNTQFFLGFGNANNAGIGVYRTTDAGATWSDFNGGTLSNTTTIRSLRMRTSDSTLYAGGAHPTDPGGQGVFAYTFVPVGVINQNGSIPTSFALYQNFPNPFNPATYIQYDIPKEAFVTMRIYDISGREVRSLVNETKQAGTYQILFDASALTSGVYFYTIKAGDFSQTMKMVLVK